MKYTKYSWVFLSIFTFLSCENNTKNEQQLKTETQETSTEISLSQAQFQQNNMKMEPLSEQPFSVIVQANGMIDVPPANKAVVNATMGGYIKTTPLLVGDKVKKGQVLVTIENPEFVTIQQEYLEVKEQLTYLKSEFDRQKILFEENITSKKKYLKAESDYKTTQAKYRGFKKQLQMLNISVSQAEQGNFTSVATIFAPISGSITKVNVSKGTFVSPATAIMEIINNDHLHLELSVFEKDIMKLKVGQKINFKIPEASENVFKAEVHLIGTSIDENRRVQVHGHLTNEEENTFLVGMFVEAQIIIENKNVLALPSDAVVEEGGKFYVLQLTSKDSKNYTFQKVLVEKGSIYNGFTEIKNSSDFKSDAVFLTTGVFSLLGE